ncbi:MAG TPA: transglutaminase-like domain-containing protein [Candidatus Baltobacteraceae bacterium]|nr:transglutaminase-like domain-containing protein [Candidatus Baltobacteraceae bacterium]
MTRSVRLRCAVRSTLKDDALVLLAVPPDTPTQRVVALSTSGIERVNPPAASVVLEAEPGKHYGFDALIRLGTDRGDPQEDARSLARWLEDGPLVHLSDELTGVARRITQTYESPQDRARQAFEFVVNAMRYVWPPPRRGAAASYEVRQGDCGEYTWIFVGLCRAMGIPARSVCGTFIYGGRQPHVWAEVYLADRGWISVDPSLTAMRRRRLRNPLDLLLTIASLSTVRPANALFPFTLFDFAVTDRVCFSLGEDHDVPAEASSLLRSRSAIDATFRWGRDSFCGKIPFLQPAAGLGIPWEDLVVEWRTSNASFGGVERVTSSVRQWLLFAFVALWVAMSIGAIQLQPAISIGLFAALSACVLVRILMLTVDVVDVVCAALLLAVVFTRIT